MSVTVSILLEPSYSTCTMSVTVLSVSCCDSDCFHIVLNQCIEFLGGNCFTPEQYSTLLELIKDQLDVCFSRASERRARRQEEDYDEQLEEELEEEDETDEQYLRKVADIMHSLFGTHGPALLPFFDQLLPTFSGMLVRVQYACDIAFFFKKKFAFSPQITSFHLAILSCVL